MMKYFAREANAIRVADEIIYTHGIPMTPAERDHLIDILVPHVIDVDAAVKRVEKLMILPDSWADDEAYKVGLERIRKAITGDD